MYVYTLRHKATVSTAITLLQIKAGTTRAVEVLAAKLTQRASTTSVQEAIQIVRKTVAATVTTAVAGTHLFKHNPSAPTSDLSLGTTATGVIGTGEGTDGDVIVEEGFNVLNGWRWPHQAGETIVIPIGGILAMKFVDAPASQSWRMSLVFREIG